MTSFITWSFVTIVVNADLKADFILYWLKGEVNEVPKYLHLP